MERQLRMGGGIMNAIPRQQYGLGSFVKKAVKGVTGAVKSAAGAVKDFAKSDLGKAALLAAGGYYLGGGNLFGLQRAGMSGFALGNLPGATAVGNLFTKKAGEATLGKTLGMFAAGSLLGGVLGQAQEEGDPEGITRNVGALRTKLADAYRNQRTFADAEDEEAAIAQQVERDVSEYTAGPGYTNVQESASFATGGRVGLAMGTPEDKAIQASGIMNLPLNQNPAGVTELDLRESGGFIPPVGVKEKADDIPAMLSNNEFVFTADAVRNMGDGNVNKGAQRMYDFMKYLENGGRV
jgi:hypothetical protein